MQACLYDLLLFVIILFAHGTASGNPFFIIGDSVHLLMMVLVLFLIRRRHLEWATNLFMLTFVISITVSNVVNDYFNPAPLHYLRTLETTLLFILAIVVVSLFTFKRYPIVLFVAIALVVTAVHYWLLIEKYYGGNHTSETLLVLLVYSLFMSFVGVLGIFSLRINKELTYLVEKETEKVKRLNQSLESKVEERTMQLESQNRELVKVNNELDRFVYRVSHDLRAPLASVLGLITISKQETDLDKVKEYLELKEKSVVKLDHFIQDIINLSKNARSEMICEEINFQEVILDIFEEHSYSEQALVIDKQADIQQPVTFYSDKDRLKIVLNNIISNAIRYSNSSQQQPFVRVSVRLENAALLPTRVIIEVSDNGQGIAAEHIEKIFNMFYRASSEKSGTGLGLYIVKETVEKLNGTVRVSSELGKGTAFTIELMDARTNGKDLCREPEGKVI